MKKFQTFIIFSLMVFYIAIFYFSLHPNVSAGYRSYYITKDSNLTLKERKALKPIALQDEISYTDTKVGYDGWHAAESKYRWSAGQSSKIVFLLPAIINKLETRILSFWIDPLGDQRVSVFINGQRVFFGNVADKGRIDMSFPSFLLADGENVIRIECLDAHATETDKRRRGVALSSFILR